MSVPDIARFRAVLGRRFGLSFEDSRLASLGDVLRRHGDGTVAGTDAFLARLETSPSRDELRALAQELTVPETYFFRNADSFRALAGVAIPDRLRAQASTRRLRLLSAGCASGEEPFSLAITLTDQVDAGWSVTIRGIDINGLMIEKATRGRYTPWALRETPADVQRRWFRADGRDLLLDARVRSMVTFEERNLCDEDPAFWWPDTFDVIFCRNVIMYLTPAAARATIGRVTRALVPGGYLFLGHAETLRGLSQDFHLRHTHETFYYQKKGGPEDEPMEPPTPTPTSEARAVAPTEVVVPDMGWTESWIETVRSASERIAQLAKGAERRHVAPAPAIELGRAIALIHEERFSEAKALVDTLSETSGQDKDVLLLRAVLLTHGGDLAEAERLCIQLLARDELSAGGHYLMALCRESAGDVAGAAEHDRLAVYLDPVFAMPRLHLGLMARRAGDVAGARRELAHALDLLEREDPSRLLLFGGGFRREALIAVCRAQLVACGGGP